mmetsp:Transcript_118517/g.377765  ORF Transcript_118517/g.377765 Transcript_118517/m.377765 type:complete len:234 (+) Transcript_118517:93-794(+)
MHRQTPPLADVGDLKATAVGRMRMLILQPRPRPRDLATPLPHPRASCRTSRRGSTSLGACPFTCTRTTSMRTRRCSSSTSPGAGCQSALWPRCPTCTSARAPPSAPFSPPGTTSAPTPWAWTSAAACARCRCRGRCSGRICRRRNCWRSRGVCETRFPQAPSPTAAAPARCRPRCGALRASTSRRGGSETRWATSTPNSWAPSAEETTSWSSSTTRRTESGCCCTVVRGTLAT